MEAFSPLFMAEMLLKLFFVFQRIRTVVQSQSHPQRMNLISCDFRKSGPSPTSNCQQSLSENLEHVCHYINQIFASVFQKFPCDFVVKSVSLILMLSDSSLQSSQKFFYSLLFEKIKLRDSELQEDDLMDLVRFVFTLPDLFEIQFREALDRYERSEEDEAAQNTLKVSY